LPYSAEDVPLINVITTEIQDPQHTKQSQPHQNPCNHKKKKGAVALSEGLNPARVRQAPSKLH
jgi:hypothetical protein